MSSRRSLVLRGSDGLPLPGIGIVALAAIPITIGLAAILAWPLKSLYASRSQVSAPPAAPARTEEKFREAIGAQLEQINGRSLFAIPPEPTKEVAKGPTPSVYGGPQVIAMINNAVWFADGSRIEAGTKGERGLRVLRINPPWSATIEWQGGEFNVDLFKRTDLTALRENTAKPGVPFFSPAPANASPLTPPSSSSISPGTPPPGNIPPGPGADPAPHPAEPAQEHKPDPKPDPKPDQPADPRPEPRPEPSGDPAPEPAPQPAPSPSPNRHDSHA